MYCYCQNLDDYSCDRVDCDNAGCRYEWFFYNLNPFLLVNIGIALIVGKLSQFEKKKKTTWILIKQNNWITLYYKSNKTIESHALIDAQVTQKMLSNVVISLFELTKSIGCMELGIEYCCLMLPKMRSTLMRTLAIFLVSSTSILLHCFLPLVKSGIFSVEQYNPTESDILKPRSASIMSPGTKWYH